MQREAAVAGALALVLAACAGEAAPPCPSGTRADRARARAIEAALGSVAEGRTLLDTGRAQLRAICFADPYSASVVTTERDAILADRLDDGEAAARLGHLIVHARDGLPVELVHAGLDSDACAAAVERALALEAHAYVVELSLQRALGVRPTVLAFEFADDVAAAPAAAREPLVLAYLRSHPHGGPGIEGLADAYRARCQ